jgi:hypothetical protein
MTVDLSKNFEEQGWAIFTPSISPFYAHALSRIKNNPDCLKPGRIPKGFENGIEGLNHLDKEKAYFYYKYSLYSIGHTTRDIEKSNIKDEMIQKRDRKNTMIIADSGGFQIGKGIIKFDWSDFTGPKADQVRHEILNWQEHTADWSMILDVPTWAADHVHGPKTGLTTFQECLDSTLHNNDFYVRNRQGKTKFLNILQGYDVKESDIWYESVKNYPFEGWAYGGTLMYNMYMAVRRTIMLRDDKKLNGESLIHILGTSRLEWPCLLTAMQRELRKQVGGDITVTYDCASPYVSTTKGSVYANGFLQGDRWSFNMAKSFDNKKFKNNTSMFPFESEIGNRLTIGDICAYGPGDLNMIGKEGKTSWDSFAYLLLMAHNVNQHIKTVESANRLADYEQQEYDLNFRDWKKTSRRNGQGSETGGRVPANILYAISLIKEAFNSETPMDLLDEGKALLKSVSVPQHFESSKSVFNNLFE